MNAAKMHANWQAALWRVSKVEEAETVLDYGCGYCSFVGTLDSNLSKFRYYGVEADTGYGRVCIRSARKKYRGNDRVEVGTLGEEDFFKRAIGNSDIGLLGSVVTHYDSERSLEILKSLSGIVCDGGRIVFSAFLDDDLGPRGMLPKGDCGCRDYWKAYFHTSSILCEIEDELGAVVKSAGHDYKTRNFLHKFFEVTKR
jgi:SAM-dependent methyltransferase